jgi:hypothetical protein
LVLLGQSVTDPPQIQRQKLLPRPDVALPDAANIAAATRP